MKTGRLNDGLSALTEALAAAEENENNSLLVAPLFGKIFDALVFKIRDQDFCATTVHSSPQTL
jgi:hypothetical protein